MKNIKKPVFFIVLAFTLLFGYLALFGVHTQYGDVRTTWIKGVDDIRWGIDIRGGVDASFTPPEGAEEEVEDMMSAMNGARATIETRMIARSITDYEIYVDNNNYKIIVRFPWQSQDEDFDPEHAVNELGEMASLTFREGVPEGWQGIPGEWPEEVVMALPEVITGMDVQRAVPTYNSQSDSYEVSLELKSEGSAKFATATGRMVGQPISIWLDNYCFSAPNVSEQISGGRASISGEFTREDVQDLANKINGGALPFKLEIDSVNTISPTVGEGARDAMLFALMVAFCAIALFMIVLYKLPGFVAVIALLGQVAGMFAVISGFFGYAASFTLTIPGITGLILSVAMGVDANVITGERIKEELRAGKTIDGSLASGFKRAFTAIFDSNITLIMIAFVLMGAFGTPDSFANMILTPVFFMFGPSPAGAIYSLGFTLIVGVIFNFIYAVFASRIMLMSISKFKAFRKPSFYGYKGGANNG
ncbi:MAG: SecD/SecF family protein translocase subunit [Oscillospiraceae bacterium]|nr:SecD/SecF family protein translocase subunit [Oscillospiraceae bacterium]